MSKIRLLLLDDQPAFKFRNTVSMKHGADESRIKLLLEQYFELHWLDTIPAMQQFFGQVQACCGSKPAFLNEQGILPEIVIFDYCLTRGSSNNSRPVDDITNPNHKFKTSNTAVNLPVDLPTEINLPTGTDIAGLVTGVLICTLFSNYITIGLPLTAYSNGYPPGELGLLEWFLEKKLPFKDKSQSDISWSFILTATLPRLRNQIIEQLRLGSIQLTNKCMENKIKQHNELNKLKNTDINAYQDKITCILKNHHLNFLSTIYGKRDLSLHGLFFDVVELNSESDNLQTFYGFLSDLIAAVSQFSEKDFCKLHPIGQSIYQAHVSADQAGQDTNYLSFAERIRLLKSGRERYLLCLFVAGQILWQSCVKNKLNLFDDNDGIKYFWSELDEALFPAVIKNPDSNAEEEETENINRDNIKTIYSRCGFKKTELSNNVSLIVYLQHLAVEENAAWEKIEDYLPRWLFIA